MQLTDIEWTRTYSPDGSFTRGYTANPIKAARKSDGKRGHACVHASTGCINCYSERWNGWRGTGFKFNVKALDQVEIILDQDELTKMRRLKSGRCFVCDMTDLFGLFVPDEYLDAIFSVMEANTGVTWQVLTKRLERMAAYLRLRWGNNPPSHIWCGCSVENQEWADKRVPELIRTPAAIHFLSAEPLLGPIVVWYFDEEDQALRGPGIVRSGGMTPSTPDSPTEGYDDSYPGIDWIVTGAESGPHARSMDIAWVRALRDQCKMAGTAFFYKQNAEKGHKLSLPELDGRQWVEFPDLAEAL